VYVCNFQLEITYFSAGSLHAKNFLFIPDPQHCFEVQESYGIEIVSNFSPGDTYRHLTRHILWEVNYPKNIYLCSCMCRVVHEACIERECYPSPLNYYQFPKSCCTSVNEVETSFYGRTVILIYVKFADILPNIFPLPPGWSHSCSRSNSYFLA
jgi:hypothetical protein